MSTDDTFYKNGIRFECTGCAKCCFTHGENTYVYFSDKDIENTSELLKTSRIDFLNTYCQSDEDGNIYLKTKGNKCLFLNDKNQCDIYSSRPMQCRTWPFWTENIKSLKAWHESVETFCPGVNNGKLYTAKNIKKSAEKRDKWYNIIL
ncbi:MAG: YkgJ family cysteine cluster protein [Deltaproteobacteria bacterium]|nr:YkgJ family cysteine cluster protein [Deltaproteobacteria bacterium]